MSQKPEDWEGHGRAMEETMARTTARKQQSGAVDRKDRPGREDEQNRKAISHRQHRAAVRGAHGTAVQERQKTPEGEDWGRQHSRNH